MAQDRIEGRHGGQESAEVGPDAGLRSGYGPGVGAMTTDPSVDVSAIENEAGGGGRLRRGLRWVFARRLCFGGLVGALVFYVVSLSPSLLPRGWLFQAIVTGVNIAIGYGLGSAASAIVRRLGAPEPSPEVKHRFWQALLVAAILAVPLGLWWGDHWNTASRELMGMDDVERWQWGLILGLAAVLAYILLSIARAVRLAARALIGLLERWIPRRVSMAVGVVIVAVALIGGFDGIVLGTVFDGINASYSLGDRDTTPGFVPPQSPLRSGSAASLVEWDSLGTQGQNFLGDGGGEDRKAGPDAAAIERFTGDPAMEPIRVYVGLRSAGTLQSRVDLAMAELERTDAFDRDVLAIYASTGTGWIDERVADSLEYLWGGDTAAVGMQYSYLPSWVSVLVDQSTAAESSRMLIDAVLERLDQMPENGRPKLFVFGESLGSFATEEAFDGLDDLVASVDGALLVGPTFGNELRNRLTDNRDEGSPAWRPVYEQGRQVRFAVDPADFDLLSGPWEEPRVVYLQNSSDPISHFDVSLLWSSPDWLDEPRAPDSNPDMDWFPIVTFWQVAADLTYSFGAPAGHGHRYGANVVDAWVEIAAPEGWTDADTQRLRDVVGHE